MIWLYGIAAAAGGYGALGWLFGTQAWGLKLLQGLLEVLVKIPLEAIGEVLGGLVDALGD